MAAPSQDEMQHALFFIKWGKEFLLGASIIIGSIYTIRKGKQHEKDNQITPISEDHIDNKLQLCAYELENKVDEKIDSAVKSMQVDMANMRTEIIERLDLMIEAKK